MNLPEGVTIAFVLGFIVTVATQVFPGMMKGWRVNPRPTLNRRSTWLRRLLAANRILK